MAKLFALKAKDVPRLRNVLNRAENTRVDLSGDGSGTSKPSPKFYIKLVEEGADDDVGFYSWKKVYPKDGDWEEFSPSIDSLSDDNPFQAHEINGMVGLVTGDDDNPYYAEVKFAGFRNSGLADNVPVYIFIGVRSAIFYVKLQQTSGSAGGPTTAASWVYTAKDLFTDVELGTSLSPDVRTWPRAADAATFGYAYYDHTKTLKLAEAREIIQIGSC